MQNVEWPSVAKIGDFKLNVKAHSRGAANAGGHYSYEVGPGAHWEGEIEVVPMRLADALTFRAFIHSLRGRAGTFLFEVPGVVPDTEDDLGFTDGTTFTDLTAFEYGSTFIGELSSAASVDDDTLACSLLTGVDSVQAGDYLVIGDLETTGQLLRVVSTDSFSPATVTIRPRLRASYPVGTQIVIGRVTGKFRLNQTVPFIPIVSLHSLSMKIQIAEAY